LKKEHLSQSEKSCKRWPSLFREKKILEQEENLAEYFAQVPNLKASLEDTTKE
jgi:hypothetical protein